MSKVGKIGIIADIHGFLRNLESGIRMLEKEGVDRILHLGDVADELHSGEEVIKLLMQKNIQGVKGGHDDIEAIDPMHPLSDASLDYLSSLPKEMHLTPEVMLVHDNPIEPLLSRKPFVIGSYIRNIKDAERVFEKCKERIFLVGHTHEPFAFSNKGDEITFKCSKIIELDPSKRYILNPGSIGTPRDSDYFSFGIYDHENQLFKVLRFGYKKDKV